MLPHLFCIYTGNTLFIVSLFHYLSLYKSVRKIIMPSFFFDRLTPRAYLRTRLFTAALVWTAVGIFLSLNGGYMFWNERFLIDFAAISIGTGLGFFKSKVVLDRVAKKIILHIGSKPCRACLGGLFSIRNWMLIFVMIVFGRTLGAIPINSTIKTGIYVMVGSGLTYSSRLLWNAWKRSPIPVL